MRTGNSVRRAGLVLASVAVLGLAACGGEAGEADGGDQKAGGESKPEDAFHAPADIAGTTTLSVGGELTAVEESDDARVLAPGVDLRLTEVGEFDVLPAAVYEDVTSSPARIEAGEPVEEVYPAEGQVFLVATYTSDDPQWEPRGKLPESEARILLGGNEAAQVFRTEDSTMQRGTIVVSVPEGGSADAAVLEVETSGQFQQLSLQDGQRLRSDVEQVYDVVGAEVELGSLEDFDSFDETFTGWAKDTQRINGTVEGGFIVPWLAREDGGDGWAGSGKVYLSIEINWADNSSTTDDNSAAHVELADGTIVHPRNDPSSLVNAFADNAVFEIPSDTQAATLVVTPAVEVGYGSGAKVHEWDPLSTELTIG